MLIDTVSVNGNLLTEEWVSERILRYRLPDYMANPVYLYAAHRIPPGNFLQAVLTNDFMDVVGRADRHNIERLKEWAQFLYNEMPTGSYGSSANVMNWLKERQL